MNQYCCVPQCSSWIKRNPNLTFHLFPKQGMHRVFIENKLGKKELIDRRKAWILKLKIGKPVSQFMRVCSLHFSDDDYFYRAKDDKKRKILNKTAVPSRKLPLQADMVAGTSSRSARMRERETRKEMESLPLQCASLPCGSGDLTCDEHKDEDREAAEILLGFINSQPNMPKSVTYRDFEVQVNTPSILTLCDLITSDDALSSFTGLNSFKLLDTIIEAITSVFSDKRVHRLTIRQRVLLTLTKLKCDLSYVTLSRLYGISPEVCKKYVFEMLTVLSKVLRPLVKFPDTMEVMQNMPKCFSEFQDVRIVLDCTEIFVQKPKCLCCRIRFYSQYKSHLTVKFMTGVSPGGIITFISKPYGGRASDKVIFEQSNIISMLQPGRDAIMVDKGFLIDDVCHTHKIKLVRPPFLRNKKQLSTEEAILNAKIASARVHIERSNQRLKIFKILSGKLQWSLVSKIKEIFTIISAITNMSPSILADSRFLEN